MGQSASLAAPSAARTAPAHRPPGTGTRLPTILPCSWLLTAVASWTMPVCHRSPALRALRRLVPRCSADWKRAWSSPPLWRRRPAGFQPHFPGRTPTGSAPRMPSRRAALVGTRRLPACRRPADGARALSLPRAATVVLVQVRGVGVAAGSRRAAAAWRLARFLADPVVLRSCPAATSVLKTPAPSDAPSTSGSHAYAATRCGPMAGPARPERGAGTVPACGTPADTDPTGGAGASRPPVPAAGIITELGVGRHAIHADDPRLWRRGRPGSHSRFVLAFNRTRQPRPGTNSTASPPPG